MIIYIVLLVILIVFSIITYNSENKFVPILFGIAGLLVFFLPAFRDISVGTDTFNYIHYYLNPDLGYNKNQEIEIGYQLFSDFMRFWGANPYVFIFTNVLIGVGSIIFFIKKESNYILYSLFIFCASGPTSPMYFLFFSGMRQTLAIAFFILALYYYNKETKNWIKIIILYLLSISFHVSVLVTLPIFLLHKIKISSKIAIVCIIITFFMGNVIASYASEISGLIDVVTSNFLGFAEKGGYIEQKIEGHESNQLMIMLPFSLIGIIIFMYANKKIITSTYTKVLCIGICLNNLLISMPMTFRLIMYFVLTIIIVLPQFIRDKEVPKLIRLTLFCVSILYFSYKYVATLENMVINKEGDNIMPYSTSIL